MQRRTKGDGGLYKRSDGMWIGVVEIPTEDGLRKRKTVSSKDRGKALNKLRDLRRQVEAGRVPVATTTTVEQWVTHWLETIQGPRVRPNTLESYYEPVVRIHLVPNLGHVRLDRLTPAQVRTMLTSIGQASTRNAQKAHQVLGKALADAVKEGILARNVVDVVDKPDHIAEEVEPFTVEEARQIITTAFRIDDPLATMWVMLFFTTARQGEAIGMELDRCDLEEGVFRITWQLQDRPKKIKAGFEYRDCTEGLIWTRPKSKRRSPPMTEPVWKMMRQHVDNKSGPNPHGLVWHHRDGRPISPHDADNAWRALIEASGVRYLSMHATRHTSITLLNNARVTQETRMSISGHSTVKAQEGYVHSDIEAERAALSNLNELLR
ncbi:Putative phage integrase [Mycobacteroides abscessus subsp. abscessus]|uniref:tyrosine-type recombinase/integrase n=1 Tax=Mycobacteroides abscessus TaxID=36809 RepID=UPI0009269226|nr:tyrosine-type recombinase/integrase [Mycobacteroides abscessus]SIC54968.1 Putative phage integrase [Mycobacteroides abscessus subsp. abscessus]SKU58568.1 Putative phage integrase [Mycobacteroides abscessus subsp. abscessus]